MVTIDTATKVLLHCSRCNSETYHEERGKCKKTDCVFDDASRTEIHFAEAYSLMQCQVCGQAQLQVVMWNSENNESPPRFFPPPNCRRPPDWLKDLKEPLRALLMEVYSALDAGMYSIALMGVRAVLDVWVSSQTSGRNDFPNKLCRLAALGTLSARQVEVLQSTFEAGSAAAHRGYSPALSDAIAATEAVENLLHQDMLLPRIAKLKGNTPQRTGK